LVALGNTGGPGAVETASRYLGDSDWVLRGHAAWALGALGGDEARSELAAALDAEVDGRVRMEIEAALR
jgi:epoxyqueuosine reductase